MSADTGLLFKKCQERSVARPFDEREAEGCAALFAGCFANSVQEGFLGSAAKGAATEEECIDFDAAGGGLSR